MFKYTYVRPTITGYGHTNVHFNGDYMGYIIQDRSKFRTVKENWVFVPNDTLMFKVAKASNRNLLVSTIEKILRNEYEIKV